MGIIAPVGIPGHVDLARIYGGAKIPRARLGDNARVPAEQEVIAWEDRMDCEGIGGRRGFQDLVSVGAEISSVRRGLRSEKYNREVHLCDCIWVLGLGDCLEG